MIDLVAKKSFLVSVTSSLHEFISEVKTKIMFQAFSDQIADLIPDKTSALKSSLPEITDHKVQKGIRFYQPDEDDPECSSTMFRLGDHLCHVLHCHPTVGKHYERKFEGLFSRLHTMPTPFICYW